MIGRRQTADPFAEVARPAGAGVQRLVMVGHSSGSHGTGYALPAGTTGVGTAALVALNHGYTLCATDFGTPPLAPGFGPVSWGNQSALDAGEALVDLCTTGAWAPATGDTGMVALIGYSMGFLSVLRWAAAHPDRVACLVGMVPAVNLAWVYEAGDQARRDQICTAHGVALPAPATLPAAIGTVADPSDPAIAATIAGLADAGVPVEAWSSIGDTLADVDPDPHVVADWCTLVGARHRVVQSGGHFGTGAPLGALYVDVLARGRWS